MTQRTIKFRFWNRNNKKMTYWPKGIAKLSYGLLNPTSEDNNEVMQFTGLHDKNGTEIYENDIVHIKHPHRNREWTGQVIYEDYGFTGDGFYFSHFDYPTELFSEGTEYIEVIGNIYQNPELLEQEKI